MLEKIGAEHGAKESLISFAKVIRAHLSLSDYGL